LLPFSPFALLNLLAEADIHAMIGLETSSFPRNQGFAMGDTMRKRLGGFLAVCVATASLAGCAFMRNTGPCLGVGCPAGTPGQSGQYKLGEGPKGQPLPAQAKKASDPGKPAGAGKELSDLTTSFKRVIHGQ
jgi:hypothetical protein